jgi:DNA-binding response OmpR family regulator
MTGNTANDREAGGSTASRLRVLVVDDEQPLAELVGSYLEREGFSVSIAGDGARAVALARELNPSVIVLDMMLPTLDGIEACRQIREFSDAYIVMLTAKAEEADKIVGLSTGADDYVTKPFSPPELVARIRAMLRRPRPGGASPGKRLKIGVLEIDPSAREVVVAGEPVELTKLEVDLLEVLASEPRVAFSRRRLLERIWGADWFGDDHVVDVHLGNVRRKLGDDATSPRYIRTVRGVGYRIGEG